MSISQVRKFQGRFSQIERVELKDDPNALLEFEDKLIDQNKNNDEV